METSFALSWVKDDDEIAPPKPTVKVKKVIPRLACDAHKWGMWMTDILVIKTPEGKKFVPQPVGHYRRFCKKCNLEQKGRGSAWGVNIKEIA